MPVFSRGLDECTTLVSDDAAGETGQDRGEDRAACPLRDVSDGGGGDPPSIVSGNPATDRTVETTNRVAGFRMTR